MSGECVEYDVWVPVIHPVSGNRVNVRAIMHEHIVSAGVAKELEALFAVESATNTPDDYYNGLDQT